MEKVTINLSKEEQRKISKLKSEQIINKLKKGHYATEHLSYALEVLLKRGVKYMPLDSTNISLDTESVMEEKETSVEQSKTPKESKEIKTKAKKSKEKKTYTDETGKVFIKSDLMRRLIRLNHSIKPTELNDKLNKVGFSKAYHSEIQRCRINVGVISKPKVDK